MRTAAVGVVLYRNQKSTLCESEVLPPHLNFRDLHQHIHIVWAKLQGPNEVE